ncbi:hypothetical protein SODALDRAFT_47086 [Sodiomyces alkalinus F11]|uniref:Uncharacterized protein n=1 Tax=Sodiomyces alkalinus (strain CBS 110278 / VKM F-3762 / F11) TaxID=1314773 RepID=A0A3N2QAJ1_SODAK|nr:hypothetical protein SODALDRAFT_47086 [Sodiomyces alkalinus F11]ROT43764.1 hypothetical protein SODALDRAFT_47086 [Sodiomyces alkalinus F11]
MARRKQPSPVASYSQKASDPPQFRHANSFIHQLTRAVTAVEPPQHHKQKHDCCRCYWQGCREVWT